METLQESVDNMLIRHKYNSTSDKLYRSFEVNYLIIHSIILAICVLLPLIVGYFDEVYLIISLWVAFFILCTSLFSGSGKIDGSFIQIRSNLEYLQQIIQTKQDGLSILELPILFDRIEDTNNLINYIESMYLFHIINKKLKGKLLIEVKRVKHNLVEIFYELYNDLQKGIQEQQQILEGAKSEIEKNITGTPELIAISELQKTRLDRQIEQFEELQRVLVRV